MTEPHYAVATSLAELVPTAWMSVGVQSATVDYSLHIRERRPVAWSIPDDEVKMLEDQRTSGRLTTALRRNGADFLILARWLRPVSQKLRLVKPS